MSRLPLSDRFPPPRRHLALWTRITSASLGAYLLATAFAFACARGLPASRAEAAITGSLAALLVMPAAAIWAFAARSARAAALGVFGLTAALALAAWLLGQPA